MEAVKNIVSPPVPSGPPPHGPEPSWIENRYADDRWILKKDPHTTRNTLNFSSVPLPFRSMAKMLLWALEFGGEHNLARTHFDTSNGYMKVFLEYRRFVGFLMKRDVKSLITVSRKTCDDFVQWRKERITACGKTGKVVANDLSKMLISLYSFGPAGAGILPDGLSIHFTANDVQRRFGPPVVSAETPILPDHVARALFNTSVDYLRHAPSICLLASLERRFRQSAMFKERELQSATWSAAWTAREAWLEENGLVAETKAALLDLRALKHVVKNLPVSSSHVTEGIFEDDFLMMSERRLNGLVRYLSVSCYIIIAILTGFRTSEILSIRRDGVRIADQNLLVTTIVRKGSRSKFGVKTDRPAPLVLQGAFDAVRRIADIYGTDDQLLWANTHDRLITKDQMFDLLADFTVRVAKITDYKVTSRQFRRYFAIFFVRRFEGPEDALRYHFRHINALSLRSYVQDKNAAEYIVEEKHALAVEIFTSRARGEKRFVTRSDAGRASPTYNAMNLPPGEIGVQIAPDLASGRYELWVTDWGYCLLQKNDHLGAVCGGKNGIPNAVEAYPENCSRCPHLVIGEGHRGFWRNRVQMHERVAANPQTTAVMRAAIREKNERDGSLLVGMDAA